MLEQADVARLVRRVHLRRREARAGGEQLFVKPVPLDLRHHRPVGLEHEQRVVQIRALGQLGGVHHVVHVDRCQRREGFRLQLSLFRVHNPRGELLHRESLPRGGGRHARMRREGIA